MLKDCLGWFRSAVVSPCLSRLDTEGQTERAVSRGVYKNVCAHAIGEWMEDHSQGGYLVTKAQGD